MKSFITIVSFFLLSIAIIGRVDGNLINDLIQKLDIFPIKVWYLKFIFFIEKFRSKKNKFIRHFEMEI